MKNLSLLLTLSLVSLMGACNAVNSGTPNSQENSAVDSSVILESNGSVILKSTDETTAEGINIEVEEPNLKAQAQEIPVVEDSMGSQLEDSNLGAEVAPIDQYTIDEAGNLILPADEVGVEQDPDLEANEINPDTNGDVILPATENVEIPTDAESAEVVEPVAEPAQ